MIPNNIGKYWAIYESYVVVLLVLIGDMIKVNEDGLIEIPDSVLWNMLGRKITADAQVYNTLLLLLLIDMCLGMYSCSMCTRIG